MRLQDAIDFVGTCTSMCPEFEMLEREIQKNIDSLEMNEDGRVDPDRIVKAYRRSAAGNEQPLPSDVRTPECLMSTLDYLLNDILSNHSLDSCHAFVRDRTRSIRQDFTLQNIRNVTAVEVHEKIARFHILCLHEMCEYDEAKFSSQQETEQLRKVLISLMEFYDDLREEGIETENEAEFRAYNLLSHIRDQDMARQAQTLPLHIFQHPYMQRALEFYGLVQRNNEILETSSRRNKPENVPASANFYSRFFKLVADPSTPFLMACMLETHFSEVRKGALKAMNSAYMFKAGGVPAGYIRGVLGYDALEQLLQEAKLYGLVMDMSCGEPTILFGQRHYTAKISVFIEPLSNPPQKKSVLLVEPKKGTNSLSDIIYAEHQDLLLADNDDEEGEVEDNEDEDELIQDVYQIPFKPAIVQPAIPAEPTEEQKQKQAQLEALREKAAAAAAAAAQERERMTALAKKREEQLLRQQREQQERERQERERRELEERKAREKQARLEEEARLEKEARLEAQRIKEKKMEEMRRKAIMSQVSRRYLNELISTYVEGVVKERMTKIMHVKQAIKRRTMPWIERARGRIGKRSRVAAARSKKWKFDRVLTFNNPYSTMARKLKPIPEHCTPAGVQERVKISMEAEQRALKSYQNEMSDDVKHHEHVWKTENFALNIYPRVRDKVVAHYNHHPTPDKPMWQLMIHTEDQELSSSIWFKHKFGLDDEFSRRVERYIGFGVTCRMVTAITDLPYQWVSQTGGIIFSLPEYDVDMHEEQREEYWQKCKQRMDNLTDKLQEMEPQIKIPFIFTFFPSNSSSTESVLSTVKLPKKKQIV
ncbi:MAG: SAC3/GANP/Nin1/mts3/eIF-3 p25 family-domain-containing protein [Benjaminiella poitrasii]|nr:MAG: SAC3/GANP/Nin1/mts3/eIF-3 p25 family-domain-containing protein [Benjaminiella poitrasii]